MRKILFTTLLVFALGCSGPNTKHPPGATAYSYGDAVLIKKSELLIPGIIIGIGDRYDTYYVMIKTGDRVYCQENEVKLIARFHWEVSEMPLLPPAPPPSVRVIPPSELKIRQIPQT